MSAESVIGLILAAIILLLFLSYVNNVLEERRLFRVRQIIELGERMRQCENIATTFPGQFMSPALKLLVLGIERHIGHKLSRLTRLTVEQTKRLSELEQLLQAGEAGLPVNPTMQVSSDQIAKQIQRQIETLFSIIHSATKKGYFDPETGKQWLDQIRQMLVYTHVEVYRHKAQGFVDQDQIQQAKLMITEAISYVRRKNIDGEYQQLLDDFSNDLKAMDDLVDQRLQEEAKEDESTELAQGLEQLETEEEGWKKKIVYD